MFKAKLIIWNDDKEIVSEDFKGERFSELVRKIMKFLIDMGPY